MTNRRKFLTGVGALAAGSAAAVGTGAFSSVTASRDVTVNVAGDADAYLQLDSPSAADYSEIGSDGEIGFDFTDPESGSGSGLNVNATTNFGPELRVANQGPDPFIFLIDPSDVNASLSGDGGLSFFIYTSDESGAAANLGGTITAQSMTGTNPSGSPTPGPRGVILETGGDVLIGGTFSGLDSDDLSVGDITGEITAYAITDDSEAYPNAGPTDFADRGDSDNTYPIRVGSGGSGNANSF